MNHPPSAPVQSGAESGRGHPPAPPADPFLAKAEIATREALLVALLRHAMEVNELLYDAHMALMEVADGPHDARFAPVFEMLRKRTDDCSPMPLLVSAKRLGVVLT